MKLTAKQWEVLRRMAAGDRLMSCNHTSFQDGTSYFFHPGSNTVRCTTVYKLADLGLIHTTRIMVGGSDYVLTPAGREAVKD